MYWKTSHNCFYMKEPGNNRREVRLDPNEEAATKIMHQILGGVIDPRPGMKVANLVAAFLDSCKASTAEGTYEWYRGHCLSFADSLPATLAVDQLKGIHLQQWIEKRYPRTVDREKVLADWQRQKKKGRPRVKPATDTTRNGAMRAVQRVFNWAIQMGLIERSPLDRIKKPQPENRDAYLWPEQFDRLLSLIKDEPFRDVAVVFRQTGCRPLEIRSVEARQIDWQGGYWRFEKQAKGNKLKKRIRFVHLNDVALAICRKWAERYPQGPIFRNADDNPWRKNALVDRCRRLREKLDFHVCPYAMRHTFATDAIIAGVDLVTVARLLGHKNLDMLNEIYEHVQRRGDHMKKSLDRATAASRAAALRVVPQLAAGEEVA
jgi:integrase